MNHDLPRAVNIAAGLVALAFATLFALAGLALLHSADQFTCLLPFATAGWLGWASSESFAAAALTPPARRHLPRPQRGPVGSTERPSSPDYPPASANGGRSTLYDQDAAH